MGNPPRRMQALLPRRKSSKSMVKQLRPVIAKSATEPIRPSAKPKPPTPENIRPTAAKAPAPMRLRSEGKTLDLKTLKTKLGMTPPPPQARKLGASPKERAIGKQKAANPGFVPAVSKRSAV